MLAETTNQQLIARNVESSEPPDQSPFKSFWMAGYECVDHINAFGNRVDFLNITGHLSRIEDDYKDLNLLNIKTVREGIGGVWLKKHPTNMISQRLKR